VIDAVKLTTRVFLAPSEKGYLEKHDRRASDNVAPAFASEVFALKLTELDLR